MNDERWTELHPGFFAPPAGGRADAWTSGPFGWPAHPADVSERLDDLVSPGDAMRRAAQGRRPVGMPS